MNIIERVITEIILAQTCSDAGKYHRNDYGVVGTKRAQRKMYSEKIEHQLRAIRAIDGAPRCGINYYVDTKPDQNGHKSCLVYFDIKYLGKRYQVSFHNPWRQAVKCGLSKYDGKGRKTHWDGKSSSDACYELAQAMKNGVSKYPGL